MLCDSRGKILVFEAEILGSHASLQSIGSCSISELLPSDQRDHIKFIEGIEVDGLRVVHAASETKLSFLFRVGDPLEQELASVVSACKLGTKVDVVELQRGDAHGMYTRSLTDPNTGGVSPPSGGSSGPLADASAAADESASGPIDLLPFHASSAVAEDTTAKFPVPESPRRDLDAAEHAPGSESFVGASSGAGCGDAGRSESCAPASATLRSSFTPSVSLQKKPKVSHSGLAAALLSIHDSGAAASTSTRTR